MASARKARGLGVALIKVEGNANEARRLINRGADVKYVYRFIHEGVERSKTPLIEAAALGHANVVSEGCRHQQARAMQWTHSSSYSSSEGTQRSSHLLS